MGKRRLARELAMQMLFQRDVGGATPREIFATFVVDAFRDDEDAGEAVEVTAAPPRRPLPQALVLEASAHARRLVEGVADHVDEVDGMIRMQAENWRLERMPPVDRNILRLAVYELLYEVDVPKLVVVDEAVELAKRFGGEQSGRFINGVLDGLIKSHVFPGSLT